MNRIIVAIIGLGLTTGVQAALDGFYAGIVGGYGNTHYLKRDLANSFGGGKVKFDGSQGSIRGNTSSFNVNEGLSGVRQSGPYGRASFGYQFMQNLAVEMGYARFTDSRWREGDGDVVKATEQALDLLAKFQYPLMYDFSVFAKLGAAYVTSGVDFSGPLNLGSVLVNGAIRHHTLQRFTFAYGVGAAYDFTPRLSLEGSYLHYLQTGNIAPVDMIGAGLVVHFA